MRDFWYGIGSTLNLFPVEPSRRPVEPPKPKTADEVIAEILKTHPETLWPNHTGNWHPAATLWTWK